MAIGPYGTALMPQTFCSDKVPYERYGQLHLQYHAVALHLSARAAVLFTATPLHRVDHVD